MTFGGEKKDLLAEMKTPEQSFEYTIPGERDLKINSKQETPASFSQQTGIEDEPVGFIQRRGNQNLNNQRGNSGRPQ